MRSRRLGPETYRVIALVALAALVVIVISGAAVRLTGSGLGCPDWPTCENHRVVAPLSYHPLIEFTNRVFTGFVSIAVMLAVLGSLFREQRRRDLTLLSLSLVVGVIAQAVVGGMAVLYKLSPAWVMAHFLLSMVIVWAAVVLHHRAGQPDGRPHLSVHKDYVYLGRAMFVLSAVVLFVGTMVTGSGTHAGAPDVPRLGFKLHDITKVHGAVVWLLIGVTALTVFRLNAASVSATLIRKGEVVMALLLVQGAIGYMQYATHLPPPLVLVHLGGATAVWISVIRLNLGFYERWPDLGITGYDGDGREHPALGDFTPLVSAE